MWRLRVREHGFHLLLTSPAILLCVVFLVVPLLALLDRSVRDGPRGVLVENEVVQPVPSGAVSTVRVSHAPLAGVDRGGRVTAADVTVTAVTPVAVDSVDAGTGRILSRESPPADAFILVSYNDVAREIVIRRPGAARNDLQVKRPPVRDANGDGRVTAADVRVWVERPLVPAALEPSSGSLTLPAAIEPSEQVLVTYRYRQAVTLAHYARILSSEFYRELFRTTFEVAVFTTVAAVLVGYPVAYFLANTSARWRTLLMPLVIIPFWTSLLVRTFAWQVILGKTGLLNWILTPVIVAEPVPMMFNRFGVYVGMVHVLLPFIILPAYAVMRGIPEHLTTAATSLGASPLRAFLRVYLPLSVPGVAAGGLLVFIVSLGFFLTPALLGRAPDRMVSNMIELALNEEGNWELASALAFLLLAATALLYVLYIRIVKIEQLYATPEARSRTRPGRPAFWRTLVERAPFPRTGLAARIGDVPFGARFAAASAGAGLGLLALARWVYEMPMTLLVVLVLTMAVLTVLAVALTRRAGVPVPRVALAVFVGLVLLYLVLPNVVVIPISFTHHPVFLSFPGTGFTLENFAAYFGLVGAGHFKASGWLWPTLVSFEVAMMVVIVCVPLGSLAAYGLVRGTFVGRDLINYLLISPLIVPAIITAVALFMFLSRNVPFMLGSAISLGPLQVPLGFVVAHSLLAMPFVIVILSATLRGIDPGLERAARSLGASRLTTLRRIVLPLMTPGIAASALFAFLTSFDEIVIAIFLSTPDVATLPKRMWDAIRFEVDPTIAAISTLLVLLTVVVLLAAATVQQLVGRRQLGGTRAP